jgi:hypothetical protein
LNIIIAALLAWQIYETKTSLSKKISKKTELICEQTDAIQNDCHFRGLTLRIGKENIHYILGNDYKSYIVCALILKGSSAISIILKTYNTEDKEYNEMCAKELVALLTETY